MVGGVSGRRRAGDRRSTRDAYGLTAEQQEYAAWVRSRGRHLDGIAAGARRGQPAAGRRRWASRAAARAVRRERRRAAPRRGRDAAVPAPRDARHGQHRGRDRARPAGARQPTRSSSPATTPTRDRWLPGVASGDVVAGVRAVRARRRLGRRRARPRGATGRRRLDAARHEDLDLQRPRRRRLLRLRPHHARRAGARASPAFAVAGDSPGPDRRAPRHGRPARARHAPLRRRPGRARRRARRGRPGLRASRCGTLDLFRPSVGAFAVGMAQAALDASLAWAQRARGVRRPR